MCFMHIIFFEEWEFYNEARNAVDVYLVERLIDFYDHPNERLQNQSLVSDRVKDSKYHDRNDKE